MIESAALFAVQASSCLLLGLVLGVVFRARPSRAHFALVVCSAASLVAPIAWQAIDRLNWGVLEPEPISESANQDPLRPIESSDVQPVISYSSSTLAGGVQPGRGSGPQIPIPLEVDRVADPSAIEGRSPNWIPILLWAWLGLSLVGTAALARSIAAAWRLVHRATPVKQRSLTTALERAQKRVLPSRNVRLLSSTSIRCPMVWCWGRVAVLVPACMSIEGHDLEGVFRHELAHVRRCDHLATLLGIFVVIVMPWNPLGWIVIRRLRTLSERVCDDWATAEGLEPVRYAESLLRLRTQGLGWALQTAASSRSELLQRVTRLLSRFHRHPEMGKAYAGGALVGGGVLVLAIALVQAPATASNAPDELAADDQDIGAASDPDSWSDEEWAERLTTPDEDARWFVGANLGRALSDIDGERAYAIASANWGSMAVGVRKQFLKGFTPGFKRTDGINARFFEIQHLGMRDDDPDVQSFARSYIGALTFNDFRYRMDDYDAFRQRNKGLDANAILRSEAMRFLERARKLEDADAIDAALERFVAASNHLRELGGLRELVVSQGVEALFGRWVEMGSVEAHDNRLAGMRHTFRLHQAATAVDFDQVVGELESAWKAAIEGQDSALYEFVHSIRDYKDPRLIPHLIGVIEADNTNRTVSGIGARWLGDITGVSYSPFHDGAWWRRWWLANSQSFGESIAGMEIPAYPKSEHGQAYQPYPADLDTVAGKMRFMREKFEAGDLDTVRQVAMQIAKQHDAQDAVVAIPLMIGIIDADNSSDTVYDVGYFGLSSITGVSYSPFHDGAWWRRWWERNKAMFPAAIHDDPIPELPRTAYGAQYTPFPEWLETFEGKMRWAREKLAEDNSQEAAEILEQIIVEHPGEAIQAIPFMIGTIDADNTYDTIYGVGYFGLGKLTGVDYSPYHDGAWWRRWWAMHAEEYPAATNPIPDLPKTAAGRIHVPYPEDMGTLDGKMRWLAERIQGGSPVRLSQIAQEMAEHQDPRCIPLMIGLIEADNTSDTIYGVGYFGLGELTGVRYDAAHDGAWWRAWWEENADRFPEATGPIPDLSDAMVHWRAAEEARRAQAMERDMAREFAGDYAERFTVPEHERMQYYLMKAGSLDEPVPQGGYRVVLILPGGDGSAGFHPFCRGIVRHALPKDTIGVQLVAPKWIDDPDRRVWPTTLRRPDEAAFTTEQFISAVVRDVARRVDIDEDRVFALGWSSSGPALYAESLTAQTPVDGWFIAMSVFWEQNLPPLDQAEGRSFYLLHSREDFINFDDHPRNAKARLETVGARVKLTTYTGGHGWHEDPFGHIARGITWLEGAGR